MRIADCRLRIFGSCCRAAVLCLLLLQLSTPTSSGQDRQRAEQEPRFRVDVNLVTIRFSVIDSAGHFVRDLKQEDFVAFEDGLARPIAAFEPPESARQERTAIAAAFLIDVSGSTLAVRNEQSLAAQRFLSSLPPGTVAGVYAFTDRLWPLQKLTADRKHVVKGFEKTQAQRGRTRLYDSFIELAQHFEQDLKGNSARKVVIVISDAKDDQPGRMPAALESARRAGITVFSILVPSTPQTFAGGDEDGSGQDREDERIGLFERFAQETGGSFFAGYETLLDFEGTLAHISGQLLGSLYTIGFYTEDPYKEKHLRNISIEVKRPNLQVTGLFTSLPQQLKTKKAFLAALFSNSKLAELPMDLHTHFHEIGAELDLLPSRGNGLQSGIPFRIKVSPYSLFEGKRGNESNLGVIGVLVDGAGREVTRLRDFFRVSFGVKDLREGRGIVYNNKLLAPPGIYRLKVALLDLESWRMTAFDNMVEIH